MENSYFTIYVLKIQGSNEWRYVGVTNEIERRFEEHKTDARQGKHIVFDFNNKPLDMEIETFGVVKVNCVGLKYLVEYLANCYVIPFNYPVFRNSTNYVKMYRIDREIAKTLLDRLVETNQIEYNEKIYNVDREREREIVCQ